MKTGILEADSLALKANAIEIIDFCTEIDFTVFEKDFVNQLSPVYALCKIPSENLCHIHFLEDHGFRFMELQLSIMLYLDEEYGVFAYYPYRFENTSSEDELDIILKIADECTFNDRYINDPQLKAGISRERYRLLVTKSYQSDNEELCCFYNSVTKEIIGFRTHKILNNNEALLFLGGIARKYRESLDSIIHIFHFNYLKSKGIKIVHTNVSGRSYEEMNLEIKGFRYEIKESRVVLRKLYLK